MIVVLVLDQLPGTPSRTVPPQFGARLVSGALWRCDDREQRRHGNRRGAHGCGRRRRRQRWAALDCAQGWRRLFVATIRRRSSRTRSRSEQRSASPGLGRSVSTFDAIVVGAGQAGPSLAGRLTGAGMTVALIERHLLGGTCVNTGCMPTKALVASAYAAHMARRARDFGVVIDAPVHVDMRAVHARSHTVTLNARANLETWFDRHARARPRTRAGAIRVTGHRPRRRCAVHGAADLLERRRPRHGTCDAGIDTVKILTNTGIVALDALPEHLVVVGGSYVGLEFAQMYRRFGARVTVVEKSPRLASREDEDVSQTIREIVEAEGVVVRTEATCISFAPDTHGVAVRVDCTAASRR